MASSAVSFDALLAQMHDPDSNVRRAAATALGGMGEEGHDGL